MNCTINDSYDGNIKYEDSKDRIQILYSSIRVDNLMKANELFNDNSIIAKSNLSKIKEAEEEEEEEEKEEEEFIPDINSTNYGMKKSNNLSTGAIVGIIIPCVAALVAISIASFLLTKSFTALLAFSNLPMALIFGTILNVTPEDLIFFSLTNIVPKSALIPMLGFSFKFLSPADTNVLFLDSRATTSPIVPIKANIE